MDNEETPHMKGNRGNLASYFNMSNNITIGNGHHIPVVGSGHASLPNSLTLTTFYMHQNLLKTLFLSESLQLIMISC